MQSNFEKTGEKETHLNVIISSLKKAKAKFGTKDLITPKDYLLTKICDFMQINNTLANSYLKILESRNIIKMDKLNVIYNDESHPDQQLNINGYNL